MDAATATLWGTLATSVFGFIASVIWGAWDRRRQDRIDAQSGTLGERQFLSQRMQELIAGIEKERDYLAEHKEEAEEELDLVWHTAGEYAKLAHEARHAALNHISNLTIKAGVSDASSYRVPEIPSFRSIYAVEKAKAKAPPV